MGDALAFWRIPRHDLLNSNAASLLESLTHLKTLDVPQNTAILFGHGERVSYADMLNFDCFSKPLALSVKAQDGDSVQIEDSYFDGDTLMLPFDEIVKVINTSYFYNNASRSAATYLPGMTRIKVKAESSSADFGGFTVDMKAYAQLKDGELYLPGGFIAQIYKNFLTWKLEVIN